MHKKRAGFTLVSLGAVIAVLALCLGLLVASSRRAQERTRIIVCQNRLKQFGLACRLYAEENKTRLPVLRTPGGATGTFAWDLPGTVADALIQYGMSKKLFYCPSWSDAEIETSWSFAFNSATPQESFRTIGYAMGLPNTGGVRATNTTEVVTPNVLLKANSVEVNIPADQRELLSDATISQGANEKDLSRNRYTRIQAGFGSGFESAHLTMSQTIPSGGNISFVDSHVEWRRFSRMRVRTDSVLTFWW